MRRPLLALPLLLALALAAAVPAQAATPRAGAWKATKIQYGYSMTFKVRGARITNLVARVLETCDGSTVSTQTTVGPGLSWTVKGGRFSRRHKEVVQGVTVYTELVGRFTSPTTATGTLRQQSVVAGSVCDTYRLKFTARRR
jgi:hypothetical protein